MVNYDLTTNPSTENKYTIHRLSFWLRQQSREVSWSPVECARPQVKVKVHGAQCIFDEVWKFLHGAIGVSAQSPQTSIQTSKDNVVVVQKQTTSEELRFGRCNCKPVHLHVSSRFQHWWIVSLHSTRTSLWGSSSLRVSSDNTDLLCNVSIKIRLYRTNTGRKET